MEISKLINSGSNILKKNKIKSHKLDSEILLSEVLRRKREDIIINHDQKVESCNINRFQNLIERRSNKEPVAYILKEKEFWSKKFLVNRDTLIPRPETELLVEKIIKIYKEKKIFILDIGTGSGCILISILDELTSSRGLGIDISSAAIRVAKKNAARYKMSNKIKFYTKNFEGISNTKFDLVVSNPPYISSIGLKNLDDGIKKFEPKLALNGGNDGLDVIKKVIYKSKNILKLKGMLALEIGNGQYKKVSNILRNNKFKINFLIKDYKENIRCIISTLEK